MKYFILNNLLSPSSPIPAKEVPLEACQALSFGEEDLICLSGEACLDLVYQKLPDGAKKRAIDLLKNKFLFRSALAAEFPEFQFAKVSLDTLRPVERKSVLKPVKGFFSAGVRVIEPGDNLEKVKREIGEEMTRFGAYFSEAVLSQEEWILEEFIEGEEIAVDLYYDGNGSAVLLNLTTHPMPTDPHYLNVVYWTSKQLFDQWKKPLQAFFDKLNRTTLRVTHFPLHAEFRVHNKQLIPVEINPLRFGGFGLGDLPYHAFGVNSYEMFFQGERPDWDALWRQSSATYYCWVLGYNGKDVVPDLSYPNHNGFLELCDKQNVLSYRAIDWRVHPVFAIAYLQLNTDEVISELLQTDFNRFFESTPSSLEIPAV